ncbi:pentatricopeptide repeat-containing protein At4g02750-like [Selaginella moellendorffii]|uniref:pentatricopeptide repeat-containing protein At4g02750-like n=1 Tax=Selaginella moellendorffii TaxID=88036 RepID=UPI000D1C5C12|nr:pentatricopeptide repeat-containing protein At4g02750-like [Selaginella moellendorffii]|eukprot:XP_024519911.1 pentatricopeptide repeat-containing protein At4g02750-like [Selaginella moellendorffii]
MRGKNLAREESLALPIELLIRECTSSGVLCDARRLHSQIVASGRDVGRDKFLANLLVQMYGACGSVEDAAVVFRSIQQPNSFSYNMMIAALVRNGCVSYARDLFDTSRLVFDTVSWNAMIKGYIDSGWIDEARQLFEKMPHKSTYASNALIAAYARTGQPDDAQRLFETMTVSARRDFFSWTGLMTA